MAILKNTTIADTTGFVQIPKGNTYSRSLLTTTIQAFLSAGTSTWTVPAGVYSVEVLVVAGGGGGGYEMGGGGGAGGLIYVPNYTVTPGASITVTVGAGGSGRTSNADNTNNAGNSVFDTLTALGGGAGGNNSATYDGTATGGRPTSGGSGGGNGEGQTLAPGTSGQGFSGGAAIEGGIYQSGGGGGAGGPGSTAHINGGGAGGVGLNFPQFAAYGDSGWFAGGGGGGVYLSGTQGRGGRGGGGDAGAPGLAGVAGTVNTGGGGGGGSYSPSNSGGAGGRGIVLVRYTTAADSSNLNGAIRYNTDIKEIEVFEPLRRWTAIDSTKNYAGHNLFTYSQDYTQATWTRENTLTVTANYATAPDGTNTANRVIFGTGSLPRFYQTISELAGKSAVLSCWIKSNAGTSQTVTLWLRQGGFGTTYIQTSFTADVGTWKRVYVTANIPSGASVMGMLYQSSSSAATQDTLIWGMQLEEGTVPGPYTFTGSANASIPGDINGWRVHKYTSTGTSSFSPANSGTVEVMVVGGGGAGGGDNAGGGGAGGLIYSTAYPVIGGELYTVTVGAGGANAGSVDNAYGTNGSDSIFGRLTAIGGGAGGAGDTAVAGGKNGGSGGGAAADNPNNYTGGAGTYGQGHRGGLQYASSGAAGGGGGAGGPGFDGYAYGGDGGPGLGISITGGIEYYAGGGGGGNENGVAGGNASYGGAGGIGGGGRAIATLTGNPLMSGLANTGGGGAGATAPGGWADYVGGNGGSGIVVIRYKYG